MNKTARSRKFTAKQSARLGAYLAAGVAASMGASSDAEAAIVYFPAGQSIAGPQANYMSFGSININTGTFIFNDYYGPLFGFTAEPNGNMTMNFVGMEALTTSNGQSAYFFYLNDPINSSITYWNGGAPVLDWNTSPVPDTGYIGLRINQGGGNFNYGWAQLSFAPGLEGMTVVDFAFETTANTSINAGAVPEPSTVALAGIAALVLGGSVYVRSRRREEAQKEAA